MGVGQFIKEISRPQERGGVGAVQQLAARVVVLPQPAPEADQLCLGLAEFVEGDDFLFVGEGEVVGDEVVEEEGDFVDLGGQVLCDSFLLELLEVIGKLFDDCVPFLPFPRPPSPFLSEVLGDDPEVLLEALIFALLIFLLFGGGLQWGLSIDEIGDDGFGFLFLYFTVYGCSFGGQFDVVFVSGVQVECGEGKVVLAALAIINLIYLLQFLVFVDFPPVEGLVLCWGLL